MKKTVLLLLSFCFVCLFTTPGEAQFLNKLKKRIKDRVEDRVVDKVADKVADKVLDETEKAVDKEAAKSGNKQKNSKDSSSEESDYEERTSKLMDKLGGVFSTTQMDKVYTFSKIADVEVSFPSGDNKDYVQHIYFNPKSKNIAITMPEGNSENEMDFFTIMDMDERKIITITSGQAVALDLDKMEQLGKSYAKGQSMNMADIEGEDFSIVKTGKTKTFMGITCDEYKVTTEDGHGFIYGTDKNPHFQTDMYSYPFRGKTIKGVEIPANFSIIAMDQYDKDGKHAMHTELKDVRTKSRSIDMSKYPVRDMSKFLGSGKKEDN